MTNYLLLLALVIVIMIVIMWQSQKPATAEQVLTGDELIAARQEAQKKVSELNEDIREHHNIVNERLNDVEQAKTQLNTLNNTLAMKNQELSNINNKIVETKNSVARLSVLFSQAPSNQKAAYFASLNRQRAILVSLVGTSNVRKATILSTQNRITVAQKRLADAEIALKNAEDSRHAVIVLLNSAVDEFRRLS